MLIKKFKQWLITKLSETKIETPSKMEKNLKKILDKNKPK
jgi:hypothetical protein